MTTKNVKVRDAFTNAWKHVANEKRTTRADMVLKAVFDAVTRTSKKDKLYVASDNIYKAFTPTQNDVKLANGYSHYKAVELALTESYSDDFDFVLAGYPDIQSEIFYIYEELIEHALVLVDAGLEFYLPEPWYVYVFVDQTIPPIHQAIQMAHVTMKLGMADGFKDPDVFGNVLDVFGNVLDADNIHLVVLGLQENGYADIVELAQTLIEPYNNSYEVFYESEFNRYTALAVWPINGLDREPFRHMKLLSFDNVGQAPVSDQPSVNLVTLEAANDNVRQLEPNIV